MSLFGEIPDGMTWCPACNGYGSSLSEGSDRCSRCGGTGLIADDGGSTQPQHPGRGRADAGS